MEVSNSFNRYDSTIQPNINVNHLNNITKIKGKSLNEAFKVDLSARALSSNELKDPSINFPIYNSDVLMYSQNLELIQKP